MSSKDKVANGSNMSASSNMSAKLVDGQSREFFWGCELTAEKPSATWTFEEEDDDQEFLQHTLFLRHAVLGAGAVDDETNIVQIETTTWSGDAMKQPILSLTNGRTDMCSLDLNFGHEVTTTFRLVAGTGPVHLSGQQMVEFPPEPDMDETEYTATESELENLSEEEELEDAKGKAKKRKGSAMAATTKKQRSKLDSDAADDDDDEGDDEEDEDEDESMDAEDDEDDEDEEDSEDEDDEEEEEKTKKGRGAAKKGKPVAKPVKKGKISNGTPKSKKAAALKVVKKAGKKAKAK